MKALNGTYFSLLPFELFEEIIKNVGFHSSLALFDAYGVKNNRKVLDFLSKVYLLPTASTLRSLIVFHDEMEIWGRLEHCVQVNDVDSFERLLKRCDCGQFYYQFKFLWNHKERGAPRPEIAKIYVGWKITRNKASDYDILVAAYNNNLELIQLLISLGVRLGKNQIYDYGWIDAKNEEIILALCVEEHIGCNFWRQIKDEIEEGEETFCEKMIPIIKPYL